MKKLILVAVLLALLPATAKADCAGFLDCIFGWSDRVETRQAQMTERERINAQRDADVARIQSEEAERVRQADAEVERVKLQRYETEARRDIAIAQAEQAAQQYKAMIAGLTSEKIAGINANANTQIAALQAQAEIATAGILETGKTERYRIVGGWTFGVVAIVLIAALLAIAIRRHQAGQTVVLLSDPGQYRRLQNRIHGEIEVDYATKYPVTKR